MIFVKDMVLCRRQGSCWADDCERGRGARCAYNMACTIVLKSRQITHSERTPPFLSPFRSAPSRNRNNDTSNLDTLDPPPPLCCRDGEGKKLYNIIHKRCHYTYLYIIVIIIIHSIVLY